MTAMKALSHKDMNGLLIVNLGAGLAGGDAVNLTQLTAVQAFAISRANHTGTQLAATVSDFDAAVRISRLDQMAAPTGAVAMNGQLLTGLADPVSAQDSATRAWVLAQLDGVATGLIIKGSVRAAATANVSLAAPGATIDGVTAANGDVFLLTAQTTGTENGPYVYNGAASAMTRAPNWNADAEAALGSFWIVREGTNADLLAILTNDTAITLGTSTPAFVFRGAAGGGSTPFAANCPAVSAGANWDVVHNLGTRDVDVTVRRVASPYDEVRAYNEALSTTTVRIIPDIALSSGEYRAIVRL